MASFWSELSKPKPAANFFAKKKTRQIGQWFCWLTIAVFYKMSVFVFHIWLLAISMILSCFLPCNIL
jgi:hypothetical protein